MEPVAIAKSTLETSIMFPPINGCWKETRLKTLPNTSFPTDFAGNVAICSEVSTRSFTTFMRNSINFFQSSACPTDLNAKGFVTVRYYNDNVGLGNHNSQDVTRCHGPRGAEAWTCTPTVTVGQQQYLVYDWDTNTNKRLVMGVQNRFADRPAGMVTVGGTSTIAPNQPAVFQGTTCRPLVME